MSEKSSLVTNNRKIRIITQVLTEAIKLWLRTQLSQVSHLEVEIKASDRQLLSGSIPEVSIVANHAVYQGLHITEIQIQAENIRVNIGSILKGKPLTLLEIVPIMAQLIVEEEDLNLSLSSALLSTALNDVLVKLLPEYCSKSKPMSWQKITLEHHKLILAAIPTSDSESTSLNMCLGLQLLNGQELRLAPVEIYQNQQLLWESNSGTDFDLGTDVDIQELTLIPGKLVCCGQININP
ncbi:hypothetical protein B6N60_00983 [Richelia sinica FACHB-800]|uniref:DUF2993 domain-containing protein n=1 Tax=Richelia sinica FACHB-800 TaxID=1357546 RepID=A0A975T6H4_9NOST|nr:DUF2993 domain-containing protein [Richelia sinica]MBD2664940.1 DUF2993 domain-containing protein [Richelia sinica FACHB-800]QXE22301.1 hypothetical protein B6N60_00983 [Richelia sinica FACHB-800]